MGDAEDAEDSARTRRIATAVLSGTGYGGVELLRLLRAHPHFALVEVTARHDQSQRVCDIFPQLPDMVVPLTERVEQAELVFVALPDHAAVEVVPRLLAEGRRVVDLSAGFRLRSADCYPEWYGYAHPAPDLLREAVYGVPELHRAALPSARLVAGPGCYPTATLLALAPLLAHGLIAPDIIVDAKSGVSGAGRGLTLGTHYAEASEDVSAYGLGGHRHWPEMLQELTAISARATASQMPDVKPTTDAQPMRLTFTPHLVPMTRGILATCYADPRPGARAADVQQAFETFYRDEPFVHVCAQPPHTKHTAGSNHAYVYPTLDERAGRLVVICALDNLGKGAAGQAIQCANAMYRLPETLGLTGGGLFP